MEPRGPALSNREIARCRAVRVSAVVSQDTFGHGEDRDPPIVESIHLDRRAAEESLARRTAAEADNPFVRMWIFTGTLDELLDFHGVTPDALRRVLRRADDEAGAS